MSPTTADGNWITLEGTRPGTVQVRRWPAGQAAPEDAAIFSTSGHVPWVDATDRHAGLTWEDEQGAFLWIRIWHPPERAPTPTLLA